MKPPKKQTQIQRIKVLEKVVSTMWNVVKQQGEEIKKLKDITKTSS